MKAVYEFCEKMVHRSKKVWADEKNRVNLLVCAGLAGLMLLALSAWIPSDTKEEGAKQESAEASTTQRLDYAVQMEQRLQELIATVDGVGAVKVMVTLRSDQEKIYATDTQTASDGMKTESHVLLSEDGLVETTRAPQILGVAVVCEGGGYAAVQNRVSMLVEALTGVGANHITVAPMAPTE